jgi:hypothetical protein
MFSDEAVLHDSFRIELFTLVWPTKLVKIKPERRRSRNGKAVSRRSLFVCLADVHVHRVFINDPRHVYLHASDWLPSFLVENAH